MTKSVIRAVKSTDTPALAAIHQAAFAPGWTSAAMTALLRNGARGWIADGNMQPIGFVLVRGAADEAEVLSLAVLPGARRNGLGAALLDTACKGMAHKGVKKMFLDVSEANDGARKLYEQAGFIRTGVRPHYYEDGAAAVLYERLLM